jgi:uncharacterized protein YdeI (YjbR/CyaY-like superfamily)
MPDHPRLQPKSRAAWRRWLERHHATTPGVWLVYAKKHSGIPSLTYNDAVEEALCFGWIDSLMNPVDDQFFKQAFTPRKPKSNWSAPNRERVARMIEAGLMTEAGLKMVTVARDTGTWEAQRHVEQLIVPPDLQQALDKSAAARKHWPSCPPGMRKAFLHRLNDARRQATRAKRIAAIVSIVARKLTMADLRAGKATLP